MNIVPKKNQNGEDSKIYFSVSSPMNSINQVLAQVKYEDIESYFQEMNNFYFELFRRMHKSQFKPLDEISKHDTKFNEHNTFFLLSLKETWKFRNLFKSLKCSQQQNVQNLVEVRYQEEKVYGRNQLFLRIVKLIDLKHPKAQSVKAGNFIILHFFSTKKTDRVANHNFVMKENVLGEIPVNGLDHPNHNQDSFQQDQLNLDQHKYHQPYFKEKKEDLHMNSSSNAEEKIPKKITIPLPQIGRNDNEMDEENNNYGKESNEDGDKDDVEEYDDAQEDYEEDEQDEDDDDDEDYVIQKTYKKPQQIRNIKLEFHNNNNFHHNHNNNDNIMNKFTNSNHNNFEVEEKQPSISSNEVYTNLKHNLFSSQHMLQVKQERKQINSNENEMAQFYAKQEEDKDQYIKQLEAKVALLQTQNQDLTLKLLDSKAENIRLQKQQIKKMERDTKGFLKQNPLIISED